MIDQNILHSPVFWIIFVLWAVVIITGFRFNEIKNYRYRVVSNGKCFKIQRQRYWNNFYCEWRDLLSDGQWSGEVSYEWAVEYGVPDEKEFSSKKSAEKYLRNYIKSLGWKCVKEFD